MDKRIVDIANNQNSEKVDNSSTLGTLRMPQRCSGCKTLDRGLNAVGHRGGYLEPSS